MAATQSNGLNRGVADPAYYDRSTDSDEIRSDIDRTRSEMDRTIDELGQRLSPRSLFDDLVCSVRDSFFGSGSTAGNTGTSSRAMAEQASTVASKAGRSLIEAARENPVPAALMGAGLAWLLFEDKAERSYRRARHDYNQRGYGGDRWSDYGTHSGSYVDARTGKPYSEKYGEGYADYDYDGEPDVTPPSMTDKAAHAAGKVKSALGSAASAVGSAAHAVGDAASSTAHAASNLASKTSHAASSAGHSMRSAGSRAGEYSRQAGGRVRHAGSSMRGYSHSAAESARLYGERMSSQIEHGYEVSRERFNNALDEKPLAVGVAAIAAGLLAGFVLPHTRTEDRMYGRTSDRLKDEARNRAREAAEQGKEVAAHVAESALGDAESQGLTPGSLGDKVARVAKDALHAAEDSAKREGIDPASLSEKAKHVGETVRKTGKEELKGKASKAEKSTSSSTSTPGFGTNPVLSVETDPIGSSGSSSFSGGLSDTASFSSGNESKEKDDIAKGMSDSADKTDPSKPKGPAC